MPYRIDAWVEWAQPSRSLAPTDRTGFEAESKQLIPRDHPVLSVRQLTDCSLLCASLSRCPYIGLWDRLAGHARSVPSCGARVARTFQHF